MPTLSIIFDIIAIAILVIFIIYHIVQIYNSTILYINTTNTPREKRLYAGLIFFALIAIICFGYIIVKLGMEIYSRIF